jgi:hypothetical protein
MSESKAATETELQELHRLVAEALLSDLRATPCDACGRSGVEPALLRVASRFLADNGIEVDQCELADMRRSLGQLSGLALPFKARK